MICSSGLQIIISKMKYEVELRHSTRMEEYFSKRLNR